MAADFLLEVDGIKGESTDDAHPDTIEIESYSFGAVNSGGSAVGGGGGTGKVAFHDMKFVAPTNVASPELMLACASGKHIDKVTLYVRKQGADDQQEFKTIVMEDVIVSSYNSTGGAKGPTDHFTLNFTTISFEYKPQKDDQTLGSAVKTGWNVKKNAKHG
jgi:type VI secretion system secreted protein Hcp